MTEDQEGKKLPLWLTLGNRVAMNWRHPDDRVTAQRVWVAISIPMVGVLIMLLGSMLHKHAVSTAGTYIGVGGYFSSPLWLPYIIRRKL